jgi:hypothetical protein
MERPKSTQKGVLHDVLGFRAIAGQPQGDVVQGVQMDQRHVLEVPQAWPPITV